MPKGHIREAAVGTKFEHLNEQQQGCKESKEARRAYPEASCQWKISVKTATREMTNKASVTSTVSCEYNHVYKIV